MAVFVGFDVHRAQITFDALDTETGEVRAGRVRPGNRHALRVFLQSFDGADLVVAVEAMTGWRFVVEELQRVGAEVHLAEPAEVSTRRDTKRRAKTDRLDARLLRELLMERRLPEAWIPPSHLLDLRAKVRLRKTLVNQRTEWLQRIHAVLFHHGVAVEAGRVIATNIALAVLVGAPCWLVGWRDYLLVQMPSALMAGSAGIWLFYVQHQFEDTYWQNAGDWSYADAALRGSSHLKLPKLLQFFTGNIGLHHVHHLSTRVPNYNLQRAHDHNPIFHAVPTLSLWDGLRAVRLKLWDEDRGRLVTFAEARRPSASRSSRWPTATTSSSPTR
jgi:hypothetical protein